MNLILSGGGVGEKSYWAYKKFAEKLKGESVLFIPFANDEMTYDEALDWFKQEVKDFGITQIEMIEDPKKLTLELLKSFGGVYICGGNAFKLLLILKSCNAFKVIKEFLKEDGVIMGSSAGVTIFGKSADTCLKDDLRIAASDENKVNLKDTDGLNAVNGYSFFVHYKLKPSQYEDTDKRVKRLLKDGHKLICLPEETSLFVENDKISIIGSLPAEIFTTSVKEIADPNKGIDLNYNEGKNHERI